MAETFKAHHARALADQILRERSEKALERVLGQQMDQCIAAIKSAANVGQFVTDVNMGLATKTRDMLVALGFSISGNSEVTRISW